MTFRCLLTFYRSEVLGAVTALCKEVTRYTNAASSEKVSKLLRTSPPKGYITFPYSLTKFRIYWIKTFTWHHNGSIICSKWGEVEPIEDSANPQNYVFLGKFGSNFKFWFRQCDTVSTAGPCLKVQTAPCLEIFTSFLMQPFLSLRYTQAIIICSISTITQKSSSI